MDDERFCSRCGENVNDTPETQNNNGTYVSLDKNTGNYNTQQENIHPSALPPAGASYQTAAADSEMSFGKWFVTVLVTQLFGIVSIVFLFVWGFKAGPESRRRYCKAMLIVTGIRMVIAMVFSVLYISLFGYIISQIARENPNFNPNDIQQWFTSVIAVL